MEFTNTCFIFFEYKIPVDFNFFSFTTFVLFIIQALRMLIYLVYFNSDIFQNIYQY